VKLQKREESKPIISITPAELDQKRLEMRAELDAMDFEIAKNERKKKIRQQTGIGAKIKDALDDVGAALDGFGDMGLKQDDNIKPNSKPTKFIDDLATFK
jgi:hypothetical protein